MGVNERRQVIINWPQQQLRHGLEKIFPRVVYKGEVVNRERLEKTRELLALGIGVIIVANHFSRRETVQMFELPFSDPEMRKRKIVFPVAEHQRRWTISFFGPILGVIPRYIVTPETKKWYENKEKPVPNIHRGGGEYKDDLLDVLAQGGISLIFPQRTRQPHLYEPGVRNPRTIGTLYGQALRTTGEKPRFAILFVGIDAAGTQEYSSLRDHMNNKTKYTLTIGNTYMIDELLKRASGDYRKLDDVIYKELETLVSPNYIGQKSASPEV